MSFKTSPRKGSVQSSFLTLLKEKQTPVTVYLNNGVELKGVIKNFDEHAIFLTSQGRRQIIYKFHVASILPALSAEKETA